MRKDRFIIKYILIGILFFYIAYTQPKQSKKILVSRDLDSVTTVFDFRCKTTPSHTFTKSIVYKRNFKSTVTIHRCSYCKLKEIYLNKHD